MRKHLNGFECQISRCFFFMYCVFTVLRNPRVCSQFQKNTDFRIENRLRPSRTHWTKIPVVILFFFTVRKATTKLHSRDEWEKRERLQTLGESRGKRKKISFSSGGENTEQPSLLLQLSSSLHQLNMPLDITGGGGRGRSGRTRRRRERWMRRTWGA